MNHFYLIFFILFIILLSFINNIYKNLEFFEYDIFNRIFKLKYQRDDYSGILNDIDEYKFIIQHYKKKDRYFLHNIIKNKTYNQPDNIIMFESFDSNTNLLKLKFIDIFVPGNKTFYESLEII